jgi:NitT/TauT family transport system ATP-binding protein
MRGLSMEDFVEELKAFAFGGFRPRDVREYLLATLIEPASLAPYLSFCSDHYTRNLVYKDDAFECLVIGWGEGQRAPIHGHEGEWCWARVEQGLLRFTNYRELSDEPLVVEKVGEPVDGNRGYLDGPADIHEVENKCLSGRAVTLHVYSRPYAECDVYDLGRGEKRRVRLTYDTMFGKPVSQTH